MQKLNWYFPLLLLVFPLSAQDGDPQLDQYHKLNGDFAASHILIAYRNAEGADQKLTRTKKEAKKIAVDLIAQLQEDPDAFEALAKEHCDCPTKLLAGYLGPVRWGSMDGSFVAMVQRLKDGQIARRPVRTAYGYHVIRREPLVPKHYSANALVLTFRDAGKMRGIPQSASGLFVDREKVRQKAEALASQLTVDNFDNMVKEHGDYRVRNGFLGVFKYGDSRWASGAVKALEKVKYGELTPLLELPVGFAILKRQRVEKMDAAQILVGFVEAKKPLATVIRTKKEARAFAETLLTKLRQDPSQFEKLAKSSSDGPYGRRGGRLNTWFYGTRNKKMEAALSALQPGEVHEGILEIATGFVLVKRLPPRLNKSKK